MLFGPSPRNVLKQRSMCFNAAKRSVVPTLGMLLHAGVAIRAQTSPKRLTDPANVLIALTLARIEGGSEAGMYVRTYVRTYVRMYEGRDLNGSRAVSRSKV